LGSNLFLFEKTDGLIFYHLIFVMMSNIILLLIGIYSQSKYSLMGVIRAVVHVISLDTFVTLVYILIIFVIQSGHFHDLVINQKIIIFFLLFSPISFGFLIIMLVEAKRAPFDHVETESEVVAGYATEHGSIFLLIFYLAEYMHLIISANHFTIFFLGGWSNVSIYSVFSILIFNFYNNYIFFF
jgi:NADH:ubiquinone oxidoreductase subunit H